MTKPLLVIIGEFHEYAAERMLIDAKKLKVKPAADGRKKLLVDRSSDYESTKKSIRLLNEDILKKEVRILRDEKVTRVFREEEASESLKGIYARYRKDHDLKKLRQELRADGDKTNAILHAEAKKMLLDLQPWAPIRNGIIQMYEHGRASKFPPLFSLNAVNVAYKAGIFDIVPVEDESIFLRASAFSQAIMALQTLVNGLADALDKTGMSEKEQDATMEKLLIEYKRLLKTLDAGLSFFDSAREKAVARNIRDNFVPGSAIICGMDHAEPLSRMLSKDFEIKRYKAGETFAARMGR